MTDINKLCSNDNTVLYHFTLFMLAGPFLVATFLGSNSVLGSMFPSRTAFSIQKCIYYKKKKTISDFVLSAH